MGSLHVTLIGRVQTAIQQLKTIMNDHTATIQHLTSLFILLLAPPIQETRNTFNPIDIREKERTTNQIISQIELHLALYLETPSLLDAHLFLLNPLLNEIVNLVETVSDHIAQYTSSMIKAEEVEDDKPGRMLKGKIMEAAGVFKVLYLVAKTRGPKVFVKVFPNKAALLEPMVNFFEVLTSSLNTRVSRDCSGFKGLWECRYIVLLWLSHLILTPFDLVKLDPLLGEKTLPLRIDAICRHHILLVTKEQDSATLLSTHFYTRRDMTLLLKSFISYLKEGLETRESDVERRGLMRCLAGLYKYGGRDGIRDVDGIGMVRDSSVQGSAVLRMLRVKVMQRVALGALTIPKGGYEEVSNEVEEVISHLLEGLRDTSTIVRWMSAKGIGRVGSKLPDEYVEQIVAQMVEMFKEGGLDLYEVSDSLWHGLMLAVAELGRRRLIKALSVVIPYVLRGLEYEVVKGVSLVGTNVRDASCYVCWAIARAYPSTALESVAVGLRRVLVNVSLYDRQISIRRAASAAFQEHAGRHKLFPHRIDLVTLLDYYNVGSTKMCYSSMTMQVLELEEYREGLIGCLVGRVGHYDGEVRGLVASCLGKVMLLYPSLVELSLLPFDSEEDECVDGLLLSLGYIHSSLLALQNDPSISNKTDIEKKLKMTILTFLPLHNAALQPSLLLYLYHLTAHSSSAIPLPVVLEVCNLNLKEGLKDYTTVCNVLRNLRNVIDIDVLVGRAESYYLALGALYLPAESMERNEEIVLKLVEGCQSECVEHRRNAILALNDILSLGGQIEGPRMKDVLKCYLVGLKDYQVDARGDVGSWVRMACLTGIDKILTSTSYEEYTKDALESMLELITLLCLDKIDRLRERAGSLFHHVARYYNLTHMETLESYLDITKVLPHMIPLLAHSNLKGAVLLGFVSNIGGLTNTVITSKVLLSYLDSHLIDLIAPLTEIFDINIEIDRITIPVMETVDILLSKGYSTHTASCTTTLLFSLICKVAPLTTKNTIKIRKSLSILSWYSLEQGLQERRKASERLVAFLGHGFPVMRREAAEWVYVMVDGMDDFEASGNVVRLLEDTAWDENVGECRRVRGEIRAFLGWLI